MSRISQRVCACCLRRKAVILFRQRGRGREKVCIACSRLSPWEQQATHRQTIALKTQLDGESVEVPLAAGG